MMTDADSAEMKDLFDFDRASGESEDTSSNQTTAATTPEPARSSDDEEQRKVNTLSTQRDQQVNHQVTEAAGSNTAVAPSFAPETDFLNSFGNGIPPHLTTTFITPESLISSLNQPTRLFSDEEWEKWISNNPCAKPVQQANQVTTKAVKSSTAVASSSASEMQRQRTAPPPPQSSNTNTSHQTSVQPSTADMPTLQAPNLTTTQAKKRKQDPTTSTSQAKRRKSDPTTSQQAKKRQFQIIPARSSNKIKRANNNISGESQFGITTLYTSTSSEDVAPNPSTTTSERMPSRPVVAQQQPQPKLQQQEVHLPPNAVIPQSLPPHARPAQAPSSSLPPAWPSHHPAFNIARQQLDHRVLPFQPPAMPLCPHCPTGIEWFMMDGC